MDKGFGRRKEGERRMLKEVIEMPKLKRNGTLGYQQTPPHQSSRTEWHAGPAFLNDSTKPYYLELKSALVKILLAGTK